MRVFAQRLAELKQTGCSILVTGTVDEDGFGEQLALSFGGPDRKQVLVTPHEPRNPGRVLPDGVTADMESVRLVSGEQARRAATAEPGMADGLGVVSDDILAAVNELGDEYDLAANDLRVGVTALDQLGTDVGSESVRRFVRTASQCVSLVNGTLYCQFRDDPERAAYLLDGELFDARVELRSQPEQVEQRWHLPADDITTDWIPV
ncbi:DUF7504 family protein [Halorussus caseinilyticus]|uniref:Uncharacterized protein n=1 Tax=Halorussus caseinilyticus TaxID=3034025 RepID=A0ABD5WFC7_9EURY|nr:hypothetical protein [Halorussus sp. DT72]